MSVAPSLPLVLPRPVCLLPPRAKTMLIRSQSSGMGSIRIPTPPGSGLNPSSKVGSRMGTSIVIPPLRSSTGIDSPPDGLGPAHLQCWLTPPRLTGAGTGRRAGARYTGALARTHEAARDTPLDTHDPTVRAVLTTACTTGCTAWETHEIAVLTTCRTHRPRHGVGHRRPDPAQAPVPGGIRPVDGVPLHARVPGQPQRVVPSGKTTSGCAVGVRGGSGRRWPGRVARRYIQGGWEVGAHAADAGDWSSWRWRLRLRGLGAGRRRPLAAGEPAGLQLHGEGVTTVGDAEHQPEPALRPERL